MRTPSSLSATNGRTTFCIFFCFYCVSAFVRCDAQCSIPSTLHAPSSVDASPTQCLLMITLITPLLTVISTTRPARHRLDCLPFLYSDFCVYPSPSYHCPMFPLSHVTLISIPFFPFVCCAAAVLCTNGCGYDRFVGLLDHLLGCGCNVILVFGTLCAMK